MPEYQIKSPRKLIEVALPLDAINEACAREKSIRHGHPSTLHLWWARRPLAAARAVIFSQLVNDPAGLWECQNPGSRPSIQQKGAFTKRRQELFKIIQDLVVWENTSNEEVVEKARLEIRRSWREVCELNKDHPQATEIFNFDRPPGLHDPFAGGGAIPLEAQRLGLEAYASDLNPVAVLINKAMIEIPPRFSGLEPINPNWQKASPAQKLGRTWKGASGLSEDVRYYGKKMREEAEKRIGRYYPKVEITEEMVKSRPDLKTIVGNKLTVIAWLWARTVKSPDPAFAHIEVPLVSTFILFSKEGKEAYVEPIKHGENYRFSVKMGTPPSEAANGTKAPGRGANFRCLISDAVIGGDYIKSEGQAGRLGQRMMAIVAEGPNGRVYLEPNEAAEKAAQSAKPSWLPSGDVPARLTGGTCVPYGLKEWANLFTPRQLVALTTYSDLVREIKELAHKDAISCGLTDDKSGLDTDGDGAKAYSEAISVYLACALSKVANIGSSIASWMNDRGAFRETFARQAIPMTWDFAEANSFADAGGSFDTAIDKGAMAIVSLPASPQAHVTQANASTQEISRNKVISTDPPYYNNIGYADLSDFFYAWLRPTLRDIYPSLLATISVPKAEELVATPYRHGGKEQAEAFFLNGMTEAMRRLSDQASPTCPVTIYYAFKQSETDSDAGTSSTGWETFLEAVNRAGLQLCGTWPMRTEGAGRLIAKGTNALASSIVLVCRKRPENAPSISRREFIRELNVVLPNALDEMTKGSGDERSPVAPVDLSQAIIGPGMGVFSKYTSVLEADGKPMSVRTALQLINRFLAEDDFDADTQFCLSWFEQNGWKEGPYGDAETLGRGKGTSVDGVKDSGVIQSGGGKVRLFKWSEYPADWDPLTDNRTPIWEALHHLIRALKRDGGESASGVLLASLGGKAEAIRQLAYRLYTLCERLGQAEDARAYNELITSWTGIETAAAAAPKPRDGQLPGFENN
jgi:putative DNA methylase